MTVTIGFLACGSERLRRHVRLGVALTLALLACGAVVALGSSPTITRSQSAAVAAAIGLRHSDLPTLQQESLPITSRERALGAQVTSCEGGVPLSEAFAIVRSPAFLTTPPSVGLVSQTEILPSVALVAKDFAAGQRSRALGCALSAQEQELRLSLAAGTKIADAHIARLPPRVSGTDGTSATRMTFDLAGGAGTKTVAVYIDDVSFNYGQVEVSLEIQTTPGEPSASLEARLARLLFARARTVGNGSAATAG